MHIAVLQKEVLEYLDPKPNENFIDATLGEAGHAKLILRRNNPDGKVLGIEIDPEAITELQKANISERLAIINSSYIKIKDIVQENNFKPDGILFDLGMSSNQLDKGKRGFSFTRDEPLIMRYDKKIADSLTAAEIVNSWTEEDIESILEEFGGERFARKIARKIVESRKIEPIYTTFQLKNIIIRAIPPRFRHSKIHAATRTFQALRIVVNNELNNLEQALYQAVEVLNPGGRIVVISFHSGEDKIVKNFIKDKSKQGVLKILTKKPITPSEEEVTNNPRSRSAKLRAALKI